MNKTVLLISFKLFFSCAASAQVGTDSVQNKTKAPFAMKDTAQYKTFSLSPVLPSNFYAAHLPFFCDKELKIQKAVKFPVKFRLGSVEDCNKLEGKP